MGLSLIIEGHDRATHQAPESNPSATPGRRRRGMDRAHDFDGSAEPAPDPLWKTRGTGCEYGGHVERFMVWLLQACARIYAR